MILLAIPIDELQVMLGLLIMLVAAKLMAEIFDFRVHGPIFSEIPALGVTFVRIVFGYAILEHNQGM